MSLSNSEGIRKIVELKELGDQYGEVFWKIENNRRWGEMFYDLQNCGYVVSILIHPSVYISKTAMMEIECFRKLDFGEVGCG